MTHHGEGLLRLTKDERLVAALSADYRDADLAPPDRAMLDYAAKLTAEPSSVERADIEGLRGPSRWPVVAGR